MRKILIWCESFVVYSSNSQANLSSGESGVGHQIVQIRGIRPTYGRDGRRPQGQGKLIEEQVYTSGGRLGSVELHMDGGWRASQCNMRCRASGASEGIEGPWMEAGGEAAKLLGPRGSQGLDTARIVLGLVR